MEWIKDSKNLTKVAAVAVALYGASKIYPLTQEQHCILQSKTHAVDQSIFPHYFANKQGLWLFTRSWEVAKPKGYVFICHGYGEHIGRYEHVARYFNAHGYSVHGVDHQGHGQSDGDRGYSVKFQHMVDDFVQFVSTVNTNSLPRFLYGHSMGGLISTLLLSQQQNMFTGAIISAPALIPDPNVATPFKTTLAKFLSAVIPKLCLDSLDSSGLCSNQTVVDRYDHDRLNVRGGMKVRMAFNMLAAMAEIRDYMHKITTPLLLVHGAKDPICLAQGSTSLNAKASSTDKKIIIYPGFLHESHNEPSHLTMLSDVLTWISQRS